MERNVAWSAWDEPGLEHLRIIQDERGILADGMIVRVTGGVPFRAHYVIRCDAAWRVREVQLSLLGSRPAGLHLFADGEGHWKDGAGQALAALDGCLDVDISATPFTNTLPICRMGLAVGESRAMLAAYISVPEMTVQPSRQRYSCLRGGVYQYADEGLFRGFSAELAVDADGLVLDYPGLFRRVG